MRRLATTTGTALAALLLAGCATGPDEPSEPATAPTTASAEVEALSSSADDEGLAEGAARPDRSASYTEPKPEERLGPEINAPTVPNCPYHEEVSEFDDPQDQADRAIELGCEPGPHGEIDFDEPLVGEDGRKVHGLISVEHAMSVAEMCEAGYISEEDCEVELNR